MSQPELNSDQKDIGFIQRLKEHPELQERFEVLLAVVENSAGAKSKHMRLAQIGSF